MAFQRGTELWLLKLGGHPGLGQQEASSCETEEQGHSVRVSGETAELAEGQVMSFSRLPFCQEMWQCLLKFVHFITSSLR